MNLDDFNPDSGAEDPRLLFGLPHGPEHARVVVIPVPFEATTSYGHGTSNAPRRILATSVQVDLRDDWVGEPWREGMAMLPIPKAIEALDAKARALIAERTEEGPPVDDADRQRVETINACGAQVNAWLRAQTDALFDQGRIPGALGGDHSISFGAIEAAAARVPGLGLLHIDAHADLREAYHGYTWSHASILFNVHERLDVPSIVSVGLRDYSPIEGRRLEESPRFHPFTDRQLAEHRLAGRPFSAFIDSILAKLPEHIWITFDVDGLDPTLCPNTGTPVPGGLRYDEVNVLLHRVASARRIVGFDLTEVGDGEWDANVGARLLYKLAGHAIHSQNRD
ncbi:MAG: agmatinase family protein [Myxococcota bacterium]